MTKLFLIAAGTILAVASGPVAARDAVTTPPAGQSGIARAEPSAQRYCFVTTVTGSLIARKTCKTRNEWMKDGVDPLNPGK